MTRDAASTNAAWSACSGSAASSSARATATRSQPGTRSTWASPVEDHGAGVFTAREGDETVWLPTSFPADYFGSGEAGVMVNYRVADLDAMLAQLRAAGVDVLERVDGDENGRFGWATDPEGNRFELWEPAPEGPGIPAAEAP